MLFRLIFLSCFFLACSPKQPSVTIINQKVKRLEALLLSLNPNVSKREALDLSKNSIDYAFKLSQKYEAIASPWTQNILVNLGLKKRGLCHEWTEDLLKYLLQRDYKTLTFHAVGANIGYLNEHNALSVSYKGKGIENSILLDAWRNVGDLYFKKIREDKKYEWKERKGLYKILPR